MTKDGLLQLIEQCKAQEAQLNQQLQNVVAQINKTVGAREMAQHLLSKMEEPKNEAEESWRIDGEDKAA